MVWNEFAATHKVDEIIPVGFRLVTASTLDSVLDVLRLLKRHALNAVPVWDPSKESFVGWLSYIDLLAAILFMNAGRELVEAFSGKPVDFLQYLEHEAAVIAQEKAAAFVEPRALVSIARGASIAELAQVLASEPRVAVTENGEVTAVVSRSALARHLAAHLPAIAELAQFTVREAGLDETAELFSVAPEAEVGTAYGLMAERRLTCLPIIGANHQLRGTISASDLHGSDLKDLLLGFRGPVAAYVEKFAHSRAVGGLYPTVVQRSDTLAHVLKKLADTHLHQLFVVDGEAVVAVCSLGDVIRTLNDAL